MLVLSRKADEQILIGDQIRVKVLKVQGNRVKLAVEAPLSVSILRGELEQHVREWSCDAISVEDAGPLDLAEAV